MSKAGHMHPTKPLRHHPHLGAGDVASLQREGSDENSATESAASGGGRYCFIDDLSGPIPRRADGEPTACLLAQQ